MASPDAPLLRELLGDAPVERFLRDQWLRLPLPHPGGAARLRPLGSWAALESCLARPDVDLVVSRQGAPHEGPAPRTLEDARALHASGHTLTVRRAQTGHEGLRSLATDFERELGAPVDVHLILTPESQQGFGWHYDVEDLFIVQCEGSKEYFFRKNTVNPWPHKEAIPRDLDFGREHMPVLHTRLEAGDWLYLPAGWWHMAEAGAASISLSVGLMVPTALEALATLRQQLLGSLFWRQRLPLAGTASGLSKEEIREQYRGVFRELGKDVARTFAESERLIRAFVPD